MKEEIGSGVTPIKRSMKYQKERKPRAVKELPSEDLKNYDVLLNGRIIQISHDGNSSVFIDGKKYNTTVSDLGNQVYVANVKTTNDIGHDYQIEHYEGNIFLEGRSIQFDFKPSIPKLIRKKHSISGESVVLAPLPGMVTEVCVKQGDSVSVGQKILVLEAMKMQNDLLSESSGIVRDIKVKIGNQVTTNQKLAVIISDK
jgi:biotin carboxyl carrier protein